jgi:hypothetical protein
MSEVKPSTKSDFQTRTEMLEFTYREVLDATKHQDDKINRLLSAIAFLTAASLALGNLDSAAGIQTKFRIAAHVSIQLGLVVLGAFLIGVLASVVILITSLTVPLRFPGGAKPALPPVHYASPDVETSPIYFTEIASTSPQQWYAKWRQPAERLITERHEALIRETHNLAVRTDFKYQQTREAVSILTFALLSLALSVVLVICGITSAPAHRNGVAAPTVQMNLTTRVLLGLTLGAYVALHLYAVARERRQTVVERSTFATRKIGVARGFLRTLSPVVVGAVPAVLIAVPFSSTLTWAIVAVALPAVSATVFIAALPRVDESELLLQRKSEKIPIQRLKYPPTLPDNNPAEEVKKVNARFTNLARIGVAIAACYIVVDVFSLCGDRYWVQLIAAYAAGLVLLAASLVQSARSRHRQVADWQREMQKLIESRR